jgi:GH35 family endo-1,4-beta-xylanase
MIPTTHLRHLLQATLVAALGAVSTATPAAEPRDNTQLLAEAPARIEQHRKADAVIVVRDAAGRPVPDTRVEVTQTRHEFLFGCNIFQWGHAGSEADEAAYRERFAEVFNFATLPFYWPAYEWERGQPRHANRLEIAAWCREHGITPKGHPLAWNFAEPRWLPDDPDAVLALQRARIDDIVARFQGQIDIWDVVNEPTHYEREGQRKQAPRLTAAWDRAGRVPFIRQCLDHARAANPRATLLVNDYRVDDDFRKILDELVAGNDGKPPFDAVGLQSHQHQQVWDNVKIWETCERFAPLGLPLHFTELTLLSGEPGWEKKGPWPSTPEGEARQADEVERFYTMVFSHPATAALTWWDFADRGAWMRAPAGFLRQDLSPKPAYDRLRSLVKERWWTRATPSTNAQGEATLRAFRGTHQVVVTDAHGQAHTAQLVVTRNGPNRCEIRLP